MENESIPKQMISHSLRLGLITIVPFYFLNLYVETVYSYSLASYGEWLLSPSENSDFSFGPFIITLVLFSICIFWFSLFVNGFYFRFFGSKNDYVYLGNSAKFNGHYYLLSDPQKQIHQAMASDIEYNYSFNSIELKQTFTSVNNIDNDLGKTSSQFSLGSLFTHLIIILFFLIPMLGTLHTCFSLMCGELFEGIYNNNVYKYAWEDSFEITLQQFQLSLTQYYLSWPILLFFMLYCVAKFPRQQFGQRIRPLPKTVIPGNTLQATPVEMTPVFETQSYTQFEEHKTRYVETSRKNVTFAFNNLFNKTVYVTAIFDTKSNHTLEEELTINIANKNKRSVKIIDDLGIIIT